MAVVHPDSVMRLTGAAMMERIYRKLCADYKMDYDHVRFTAHAPSSTVDVESVEVSRQGQTGQYLGERTYPYAKISLNALFPSPVFYQGEWDRLFRFVVRDMEAKLGWVIEPEDFLWSANGRTIDPGQDTLMDLSTVQTEGHRIVLTAKATSLRFVEGSTVTILLDATNRRTRLSLVYPNVGERGNWLHLVSDASASLGSVYPGLYMATGPQAIWAALQRRYGIAHRAAEFTYAVTARPQPDEVEVTITPKTTLDDGSLSTVEDTLVVCTTVLDLNTRLPVRFYFHRVETITLDRMRNVLMASHGFRIEDYEFYASIDPERKPLAGSDLIPTNSMVGEIELIATDHVNAMRWIPGTSLKIRFL